jgi:hypothetical protein
MAPPPSRLISFYGVLIELGKKGVWWWGGGEGKGGVGPEMWGGGFSGAGSDNLITFLHEHYVSRGSKGRSDEEGRYGGRREEGGRISEEGVSRKGDMVAE